MVGRAIDKVGTRRALAAGAVMSAVLLVSGTVYAGASARHNDVPEGSWADTQVERIAEAGIATGYRDGSFGPQAPITRAEAAAWINRSGVEADAAFGNVRVSSATPGEATVAQVGVASPAAGAGGGYVRIDANLGGVTVDRTGLGCPCSVTVSLLADGAPLIRTRLTVPGPAMDDEQPQHGPAASVFLPFVMPLEAGAERHLQLVAEVNDSDVGDILIAGAIATMYIPFSGEQGVNNWPDVPPESQSGPIVLLP